MKTQTKLTSQQKQELIEQLDTVIRTTIKIRATVDDISTLDIELGNFGKNAHEGGVFRRYEKRKEIITDIAKTILGHLSLKKKRTTRMDVAVAIAKQYGDKLQAAYGKLNIKNIYIDITKNKDEIEKDSRIMEYAKVDCVYIMEEIFSEPEFAIYENRLNAEIESVILNKNKRILKVRYADGSGSNGK